ncbi:MAG: hypothetical protein WC250_00210 [Candidatus Paceibacterota bacterium]|jgi:hypothetical protein
MQITSVSGRTYQVGKQIGQTEHHRIYECTLPDGQPAILKIALETSDNSSLDHEAVIIRIMTEEAKLLEAEFAETSEAKEHPEIRLNYHFYFPALIESFIADEQGGRRINVVAFPNVAKKLVELVPILHLTTRDRIRIDPRTSAWILGKLLKMLGFTHNLNIEIGNLSGDNILINREGHFVAVFDWTGAKFADGALSDGVKAKEISQVTRAVVVALGGDPETGELLEDAQLPDEKYRELLQKLLSEGEASAKQAHGDFYRLVYGQWPREYHPFTAYPLDEFGGSEETVEEEEK